MGIEEFVHRQDEIIDEVGGAVALVMPAAGDPDDGVPFALPTRDASASAEMSVFCCTHCSAATITSATLQTLGFERAKNSPSGRA